MKAYCAPSGQDVPAAANTQPVQLNAAKKIMLGQEVGLTRARLQKIEEDRKTRLLRFETKRSDAVRHALGSMFHAQLTYHSSCLAIFSELYKHSDSVRPDIVRFLGQRASSLDNLHV